MTRPVGGANYVFCAPCRVLTPHDADLLSPLRRGEPVIVALTCRVCGHLLDGTGR